MRIPVITGPTATGKTAAVLSLAEKHKIEIISADAYQVYRFMDIGTAKPSSGELSAHTHHLINIKNPDESYSAGMFFEQAQKSISEVIKRGNLPVIAGGTGMYVETLQKGIFDAPERDGELRAELEKRIELEGVEKLYEELAQTDPEYAEKVKPTDPTRIIRGLEINRQLGMNVFAAREKYHRKPDYKYDIYVLNADRKVIYDRINRRVEDMFKAGWAEEVEKLIDMGYNETLDSFKAIGYREIAHCLQQGANPFAACEKIQTQTRNFAKRQLTWFRHMTDITYVDISDKKQLKMLEGFIFT